MPLISTQFTSGSKDVICTHCRGICTVARRAMSIFCQHCRKRLILEDFHIKTFKTVREVMTCGDIVVEKKGHVRAAIRAGNLAVKGQVHGPVTAVGHVDISKSGRVEGDIHAATLHVEGGAIIHGFLRICKPVNTPAPETPPAATAPRPQVPEPPAVATSPPKPTSLPV